MKEILNTKEAMAYLDIKSYQTFNKMLNLGLPYISLEGSKKFNKADIDNFIKERTVTTSLERGV
ncbi:MerR family transcriptional regulator [Lactobacillus mulieris]|uniref:DNA-binding protein n=1 Tax=Lactobacillus mulieris TaxID=2508708 RepID=UPI0022AC410F|nr:DNA-binding protein [Lactobacillus mulieris]MCZ3742194.1 helix-turn-helix domain-containing protein [Lactobacillus mulieris]MCZ3749032.1 helix-turn-helix domain-containing protein [Lactobacillus mulieris]MCZ3750661.1 helix-turn-helix domain-containing protein [Lactobacillus mulieris]MDT9629390.1 DNA-binding protein [Lactobacillus mulieris]